MNSPSRPSVAIIGGGLAGMAAAVGLSGGEFDIELFESRRFLGGRAGSFLDTQTGEWIDHCQHLGMGCCTNWIEFCHRTKLSDLLSRHKKLTYVTADGRQFTFAASRLLPAPLHLWPALWALKYLSWRDRISIGRALFRMARTDFSEDHDDVTMGAWLRKRRQSEQVIQGFWAPIIVSALGETLDRASASAAKKVFVDGFMSAPGAHELLIPDVSLAELYGERLARWFATRGVSLHLGTPVKRLECDSRRVTSMVAKDDRLFSFDYYVLALPWRAAARMLEHFPETMRTAMGHPWPLASSSITAVHLWFDRPITPLPHAVMIGTLGQWLFNRGKQTLSDMGRSAHLYQIVISASGSLSSQSQDSAVKRLVEELCIMFPAARNAQLLHHRLITQKEAVFSASCGHNRIRPAQQTPISNFMLAGDWTQTGWPATMEGAVRSGYLAAEEIMRDTGRPRKLLAPDLPCSLIMRLLTRKARRNSPLNFGEKE